MKTHFIETTTAFLSYCESLPDEVYFKKGPKWNAAEVVDHLQRSIAPVDLAMGLPSFLLRLLFGRSNRPARDFQTVVNKYKNALKKGGKASGPYIPKGNLNHRKRNLKKLEQRCHKLAQKIDRRSKSDWDTIVLPHPLLGKMPLCEMIYFTDFHIEHHLDTLKTYNQTD